MKLFDPHNPKNFRLKLVTHWDETWVKFKYSINGGLTWRYIHTLDPPILDWEEWDMKTLIYRFTGYYDFGDEKEKFGSYKKILNYEKEQRNKCKQKNKVKREDERKTRIRNLKKIKKINK